MAGWECTVEVYDRLGWKVVLEGQGDEKFVFVDGGCAVEDNLGRRPASAEGMVAD